MVVRPAQYRSPRSVATSDAIAEQYVMTSPEPTPMPTPRNSWPNATSNSTMGASSGTGHDLLQVLANQFQIVAILDDCAQGVVHRADVQLRLAEHIERGDPVERFGDTRRLRQIELTQPVDRGHQLAGQRLGDTGHAQQNDLHLTLDARIPDPVVQAATLQRVVEFASAVGRQHHQRWRRCCNRADLRDRDLEGGQQLQQERLELVVGTVDLVDQQHRSISVTNRLEQRPFEKELGTEQLVDRSVVAELVL